MSRRDRWVVVLFTAFSVCVDAASASEEPPLPRRNRGRDGVIWQYPCRMLDHGFGVSNQRTAYGFRDRTDYRLKLHALHTTRYKLIG